MKYTFSVPDALDVYNDKKSLTELIPGISIPSHCKSGRDIVFSIPHVPGEKIDIGDVLIEIIFYRTDNTYNGHYFDDEIGRHQIYSEHAGYFYSDFHIFGFSRTIDDLSHPIIIYPTIEAFIEEVFPISYKIETDEFTSERIIQWKWSDVDEKNSQFLCYCLSDFVKIELTVEKNMPLMKLHILPKSQHINKRDSLAFKFEDGSILHFPVLANPTSSDKSNHLKSVSIPLSSSDIEKFSNYAWEKMRIEHFNGNPSTTISNDCIEDYPEEFSKAYFKKYAQVFVDLLNEIGINVWHLPDQYGRSYESTLIQEEPCYVYLMVDLSNGYHKIGISNHPDFREKTLQSERPTIEKICAKKYPSRIIAQSIESALHTAFSSKRVRGEWFNLSKKDVSQIIETLK